MPIRPIVPHLITQPSPWSPLRHWTFCVCVVRPGAAEGDDGVVVLEGEVRLVVVVVVVVKVVQARVGVAQLASEETISD